MNITDRLRTCLVSARKTETWSEPKVQDVVRKIISSYVQVDRHYHTLKHIDHCLSILDEFTQSATSGPPVSRGTAELALWYHDLVYNPLDHNNEEMSVAVLREHEAFIPLDPVIVNEACSAIMATRHKALPTTPLDKVVVDIDLSIFGATEERFDEYEREVRAEYNFVPDAGWISGRSKVLREFLDREWIYSSPYFRMKFEGAARANLKRSMTRLTRGEVLRMVR